MFQAHDTAMNASFLNELNLVYRVTYDAFSTNFSFMNPQNQINQIDLNNFSKENLLAPNALFCQGEHISFLLVTKIDF